jgi:hypothetical protein
MSITLSDFQQLKVMLSSRCKDTFLWQGKQQPFLSDWKTMNEMPKEVAGPVHVIACHKGFTESQAIKLLGFPDAVVVSAPFGVYVADRVQCIQMVFIPNCRDETSTRRGVQHFFHWLAEQAEEADLVARAVSRRKICSVMAVELKAKQSHKSDR